VRRRLAEFLRRWAAWRDALRDRPAADFSYRVGVGVVGVVVLAGGIAQAPLALVGLGILATEFEWARRLMGPVRQRYDAVAAWYGRQGWGVRALVAVLTAVLAVAGLWVGGVLGWSGALIGHERPWLNSPIGLGS
jgi:uncharacterized protein (TIGR02611 family)